MQSPFKKMTAAALLIVSSLLFNSYDVYAVNQGQTDCITCHNEMYTEALNNASIHKPFLENRCSYCHVEDGAGNGNERAINHKMQAGSGANQKINWLTGNATPETTHWFSIPADNIRDALYIKGTDNNNYKQQIQIDISDRHRLPRISDTGTPPAILEVATTDIRKGIFISATITWKTDVIADSTVTFDDGAKSYKSHDGNLTSNHTITLLGLKPNHTYSYSVTSRDMFGNLATASAYTFSTADARVVGMQSNRPAAQHAQLQLSGEVYNAGDRYLVKVVANSSALLAIGTNNEFERKVETNLLQKWTSSKPHGRLTVKIDRTVSLCLNCHKDHKGPGSHPVDVLPSKNIIIPADYQTSPEGKITCLTCHQAHGSRLQYMLRKSHKRELCVGCHRDKDTANPTRQLMARIIP